MFSLKSKADRKAAALRAEGYRVLTTKYSRNITVLNVEKDDMRHIATYQGSKLIGLISKQRNQWYNVTTYKEVRNAPFVKDFS